jgi:hypothetical protein
MSKKNFIDACVAAKNCTMAHSHNEVNLFCEIMEWYKEDVYFVGDDPHGVVSLGDYFFNMSDIHEVIANYEKHIGRFGSNEELQNAIIRWYDWTADWHNNHMPMDFIKVCYHNNLTGKDEKNMPEEGKTFIGWFGGVYKVCQMILGSMHECDGFYVVSNSGGDVWTSRTLLAEDIANELESYAYLKVPDYSHNINLHSWLMGACDLVKS